MLSTGNNGHIELSSGNVQIDGAIFAFGMANSNVNINSQQGLNLNRMVQSVNGTVTLNANKGSLITGTSGLIQAGNAITITSPSTTVGSITLNAAVQKTANAGAITIQSGRDLSVGSVFNNNGNIALRATSGTLAVRNSSVLQTLTGDINIQQRGLLATDLITFGSGVSIIALAPSNPLGNINVFVDPGAGPPPAQTGIAPPNVQQITSGGGQIFFGANFTPGITANGPTNTLNAKGANITFFTNAGSTAGSNAITLGGSNFFFADPPVGGTPSVVPLITAMSTHGPLMPSPQVSPTGTQATQGLLPPGITFGGGSHQSTVPLDSTIAIRSLVAGSKLIHPAGSADILCGNAAHTRSDLYVAPAASSANQVSTRSMPEPQQARTNSVIASSSSSTVANVLNGFVAKKAGVFGAPSTQVRAHRAVFAQPDERTIDLLDGEILVSSGRRARVNAGAFSVDIGSSAIVDVTRNGSVLKVRNLCDSSGKSVRINIGQMTLSVGAGQELLVGSDRAVVDAALKQDKVGRRELSKHALDDGNHIARSEFSIVGLIQRSELLHSMYAKGAPSEEP